MNWLVQCAGKQNVSPSGDIVHKLPFWDAYEESNTFLHLDTFWGHVYFEFRHFVVDLSITESILCFMVDFTLNFDLISFNENQVEQLRSSSHVYNVYWGNQLSEKQGPFIMRSLLVSLYTIVKHFTGLLISCSHSSRAYHYLPRCLQKTSINPYDRKNTL